MRFPKQRIRIEKLHEGHPAPSGWLVLDLKGLDLEGANSLVIDMTEVEEARVAAGKQDDARARLNALFGD